MSRLDVLVTRLCLAPIALALPATLLAFASCAEAEDSHPTSEDASSSIPDVPVDASSAPEAAVVDGGCDASEKDCVSTVLSCDDVPWCPVATTVTTRYALTSVWGSGPNDVWAVGSGGTIVHWDGSSWTPTPTLTPVANTFQAVWGRGPSDVWAVAMTDTIFHTTGFANGTAEWTRVPGPATADNARSANAIWGSGAGDLRIGARATMAFDSDTGQIIATDQYVLGASDDGGIAWKGVNGAGKVLGFWGSSATDIWVVADNSEIVNWQKGVTRHGTAAPKGDDLVWTDVDSQSAMTLNGIWGSSADDIWAVGDKGTLRRMKKGAARWEIVASPTQETLHAVWGSSANDVWAVGDAGTILHFDGTTWTPSQAAFALGTKPDLRGVWGSSPNDVWIVGDNVSLHYTGPKAGSGAK